MRIRKSRLNARIEELQSELVELRDALDRTRSALVEQRQVNDRLIGRLATIAEIADPNREASSVTWDPREHTDDENEELEDLARFVETECQRIAHKRRVRELRYAAERIHGYVESEESPLSGDPFRDQERAPKTSVDAAGEGRSDDE